MDTDFGALVRSVEQSKNDPLEQLQAAAVSARRMQEAGDALVILFVDRCRTSGHSWSEIGERLGVTRQAVQKKFADNEGGAMQVTSDRAQREHAGKYRPLWGWLNTLEINRVEMTFAEIEEILGFPLPPSSRKHLPHWHSYDGSAVVRAIIDAGWRAQEVNLVRETVVFVRSPR